MSADWRHGFGRYSGEEGERFAQAVEKSRKATSVGLAERQQRVLDLMEEDDDKAPR